jgi:hypothetical protein
VEQLVAQEHHKHRKGGFDVAHSNGIQKVFFLFHHTYFPGYSSSSIGYTVFAAGIFAHCFIIVPFPQNRQGLSGKALQQPGKCV